MSQASGTTPVPEYRDSGDPAWIEAVADDGIAMDGDRYVAYGRWRERIYPEEFHPADSNPFIVGRVGFKRALLRVEEALRSERMSGAPDRDVTNPHTDPLVQAITSTYDALEWVHSLDEHLKAIGTYDFASDMSVEYGPYVEGAIGARNASHHGLRRVLGVAKVPRAIYVVSDYRWVHSGHYSDEDSDAQVRWVKRLPLRAEPNESKTKPIQSKRQEEAFNEHLSGREVRNTLRCLLAFFQYALAGEPAPSELLFTPAQNPPSIGRPPVVQE